MSDQSPPNPAPTLDGAPEPEPSAKAPETNVSEKTEPSTPEGSSPEAEAPAAEPSADEAAAATREAARAAVHETAEAYQVTLDEASREALGLTDNDPLVAGLAKFAADNKKPQGWMDDALEAASELAKAGLFDAGFDPAAEAAALGENAAGRRREVEVFASALKERGDIDDGMFAELMSLSPTANGIRLVEFMRKNMTDPTGIPKPSGDDASVADAAKAKAKDMARDPKYGKDKRYTREADQAWADAFGGRV